MCHWLRKCELQGFEVRHFTWDSCNIAYSLVKGFALLFAIPPSKLASASLIDL